MDHVLAWLERHRQIVGVVLLVLGAGAAIWLGVAASGDSPPNAAQSALLVIAGGLLNAGGAWALSRRPGDPNLTASRMAASHLEGVAVAAGEAKALAEAAFDRRPPGKGREDIGKLSWQLSEIESRLLVNLDDWAVAYPDLVQGLLPTSGGGNTEDK